MAKGKVRIIHSGHWRLDQPLGGLPSAPDSRIQEFLEAPFQAAAAVCDRTLSEQADCLLLTGDLFHTEKASPFVFQFFLDQMEKLDAQGIPVYWSTGREDSQWPQAIRLPANVHRLPQDRVATINIQRDGQTIAVLLGRSHQPQQPWHASQFHPIDSSLAVPVVALAYGLPQESRYHNKVDYWAVGCGTAFETLADGATRACQCGSPQGRSVNDQQAAGALSVLLELGSTQPTFFCTEIWRYRKLSVQATADQPADSLCQRVRDQITSKLAKLPERTKLLIALRLSLDATSNHEASSLEASLLQPSRRASLEGERVALGSVQTELPQPDPELSEEDSILGDFLRSARGLSKQGTYWQQVRSLVPTSANDLQIRRQLIEIDDDRMRQLFDDVLCRGAAQLRGAVGEATIDDIV